MDIDLDGADALMADGAASASVDVAAMLDEVLHARGKFVFECRDKHGKLRWRDAIENTVVTVGKNSMLDNFLAGSAFTQTGPYVGLISSVSYSAISAADTMGSHAGWTEAGSTNAPTFSARIIAAWSAASGGAKALSAALSFSITGNGTLEGAFLVLGSGAVATLMSTAGTLFSAGLFTGGTRAVLNGDTVNVSYSVSV